MQVALITGRVLQWARNRAGMSIAALADKLKVKIADVAAWEAETKRPTFAKARGAARVLHVPFGYLFLSEPPQEFIDIPDLRSINGEPTEQLGPDFYETYQDAKTKQVWYRDYIAQSGGGLVPYVGSHVRDDPPAAVAASMRAVLEITHEWRNATGNWKDMFRALIAKVEISGTLVLCNSVVGNNTRRPLSAHAFRGFALSDGYAPVVFINTTVPPAAQVFYLAHELAHIWLDESGISNFEVSHNADRCGPLEVFCSCVAGEFLISREEFLELWNDIRSLDENAAQLSSVFKVSGLIVARRAWDLGKIGRQPFLAFYNKAVEARTRVLEVKKSSHRSGFYAIAKRRNSSTFAKAVLDEANEGRLLMRDAGKLLSVQPSQLLKLAEELRG